MMMMVAVVHGIAGWDDSWKDLTWMGQWYGRAPHSQRAAKASVGGMEGFLQPDALLPPNPVGLYFIPAFPPTAG